MEIEFLDKIEEERKIYYYSKDRKILKEVENNFNDYIVKLIKKYNHSLIEIKNDITSGNILNII